MSKGGQVGANQESEKEEKLRQSTETALKPGAHCRSQPREGRNQVVADTPFSWEEQRDSVSISAGVGSTSCG